MNAPTTFDAYDAAMADFDRLIEQTQRAITRMNETESAIAAERVAMARDLQAMLADWDDR